MVFETERLLARAWRIDQDVEGAFAMYGDPEVVRFIGGQLFTDRAAMRERIAQIIARNARFPAGQGSWALIERATGEIVGNALLKPLPLSGAGGSWGEDIEIGWHLARRHWRRGFATEAGRALVVRGFDVLGLERLHAVVDTPNERSQAVARRLGMRHTGKTTRYYDLELEHFELGAEEPREPRTTR